LHDEIRVKVGTNAPPAVDPQSTNAPKAFHWEANWRGWEGLDLELTERTFIPLPSGRLGDFLNRTNSVAHIHIEKVKMTAHLGARIAVDGAGFVTTGNVTGFDGGVQMRRALFSAGGDCVLVFPVSYYVELGYIPNQFYVNQAYLLSENFDYVGSVQFGTYGPPMGLDLTTSSRDITFMEPAAPMQALGPPNMAGFQIGQPVFDQRATWALGFFGNAGGTGEYGNASSNFGSAVGRFTWLAIDRLDPAHPSENESFHIGLSANYQYSVTSNVRYQTRPESYIAPIVIDTGDIDADQAVTFGGELAYVNGPLSLQGEVIHSFVQQNGGEQLNFGGFYSYASWFLTGESRPYDPDAGDFGRLIPRHNFSFGDGGGWGAWELAFRFSFTDLDSKNIQGGRLALAMTGLNWYLNPNLKWMFNYGMGHVSSPSQKGDMFIFQTRVGVDF
jgi:phosphate-selective porin OprO/OprP